MAEAARIGEAEPPSRLAAADQPGLDLGQSRPQPQLAMIGGRRIAEALAEMTQKVEARHSRLQSQLVERHRRVVDEGIRADQTNFFRRPEADEQVAPSRFVRQGFGQGEDRRRARRVVVGAVVDAAGFFFARQRVAIAAAPEVIVVRAGGDPRLFDAGDCSGRRQVRHDVAAGLLLAMHGRLHGDGDTGNRKTGDVRVA